MQNQTCPICRTPSVHKVVSDPADGRDLVEVNCAVCGRFNLSKSVLAGVVGSDTDLLSNLQRAAASHLIRLRQMNEGQVPLIMSYDLDPVFEDPRLPTPVQQASNLVRFVGDQVSSTGRFLEGIPDGIHAIIGAPDFDTAYSLAHELRDIGIIKSNGSDTLIDISLSLNGWQSYDDERRGKSTGGYAFIAMQFGDQELDEMVKSTLKPAINESLGYDLVDMREVARAGVIDNIMRQQIRDADFVLVDLTHDNYGAYWEAGYAEGLGKPVIYICENEKFNTRSTHFDTNHCTTVPWKRDDLPDFEARLIATIKRSLAQS